MASERKRNFCKTAITKSSQFIKSVPDEVTEEAVSTQYDRCVEAWRMFQDVHLEILLVTGDEFVGFQNAGFDAVQSNQSNRADHLKSTQPSKSLTNEVPPKSDFNDSCLFCKKRHRLSACFLFQRESFQERQTLVDNNKLCPNCLSHGHKAEMCLSTYTCRICQQRHHTLLHVTKQSSNVTSDSISEVDQQNNCCMTLLATALVNTSTATGVNIKLRALIDQGSQVSFIRTRVAHRLGLSAISGGPGIKSVGTTEFIKTKGITQLTFTSSHNPNATIHVVVTVLDRITGQLPSGLISLDLPNEWKQLTLADPKFYDPQPIDILLGADVVSEMLQDGLLKMQNQQIIAQRSTLGWLLSGKIKLTNPIPIAMTAPVYADDMLGTLSNHWEKSPSPKSNYRAMMGTIESNYMQLVPPCSPEMPCYLTHHMVSKGGKNCIVSNASMKTSSGLSLNDALWVGPSLQNDLFDILLRIRQYRIAFSTDVVKMFSQILISKTDVDYQRFVYRKSTQDELQQYRSVTVLDGTASASYLANKIIRTLAQDERDKFPLASEIAQRDIYVDDLLSRCHDLKTAELLPNDGVYWQFSPPSAPHFNGLAEAGVRSVKYHLRRIVGTTVLTYEELCTVLCQIECVLNSRPISALTDDFSDLAVFTPGHFLMGSAPISIPEPTLLNVNENRLNRWQLMERMKQDFWRIWSSEYLTTLQQRPKWQKATRNVTIGQLVIIRQDDLPPMKWLLGRIEEIHPGEDGLVRVATVRTQHSALKRPVVKLCPLPSPGFPDEETDLA